MTKPNTESYGGGQGPENRAENRENNVVDPNHRDVLRRRAEEVLQGQSETGEEAQRLIQELQIHQIELEMQNEALRQTQADLEAVRDRYYALFEQAPVGYLMLSKKGGILEANLVAANLLELDRSRLKNTSITSYIVRDDQDIFYLGVQQAGQENHSQELELRMLTGAGSQIEVALQCTQVEEQGQPTGQMRVTMSNITGRKQLARGLEAYAQRLEVLNKGLEDFAYVASHDLKEPLRKIDAFAKLLLERSPQLDEEGRDYLKRMQKAAGRMGMLIDALLALSRLTIQKSMFQPVDMNQIVRNIVVDLEIRLQETGGQIEVGPLPSLMAEPTQMQQLFLNLIGNALKFYQPGLPPQVQITASRTHAGEVEIQVADNGIGFDPEAATKLFKPFGRLHNKSNNEGTGIGLAICRKIVENHAGQITARGAPGQGATFIVTLPVQPPGVQAMEGPPEPDYK